MIFTTIVAIGLLGLIVARPWPEPDQNDNTEGVSLAVGTQTFEASSGDTGLDPEFLVAVEASRSGDHAVAVAALLKFLGRAPHVPEAHVNLGFAYLGLGQPEKAESAFEQALELRRQQANAYYGLGLVYESRNDLDSAGDAMRTFIHLAPEDDPFLRKARAALWEWGPGTEPSVNTPQTADGEDP